MIVLRQCDFVPKSPGRRGRRPLQFEFSNSAINWNLKIILHLFWDRDGQDDLGIRFPALGDGGDAAALDAVEGLVHTP